MRKGIHFLVLLAAALLLFSLPVRASDFEDDSLYFVTDEAGLLTDEEWTALETRAEELSTEYACGIYVITVDDFRNYTTDEDVYEAAKSLYQEYRLGYGEEQSGELLLLSMEERDYALIAYGYGNTAFTDYGKDKLSEKFLDDFGENSWYKGFSDYLEKSGSMLRQACDRDPDLHRDSPCDRPSDHSPCGKVFHAVRIARTHRRGLPGCRECHHHGKGGSFLPRDRGERADRIRSQQRRHNHRQ